MGTTATSMLCACVASSKQGCAFCHASAFWHASTAFSNSSLTHVKSERPLSSASRPSSCMFSRSQPRPRDSTSEHAGSGVHAEEALMRAKHRKAWLGCQAASSSDLPKNAEKPQSENERTVPTRALCDCLCLCVFV